ncbi:hypothetical protein AGMMS49992_19020 [Clostridia bacterium]|nr:hypothetical protein AGMMS49992_19020 [Clostridia bacterium]
MAGILSVTLSEGERREMIDRREYGLIMAISGKVIYHNKGKRYVSDPNTLLLMPWKTSYDFISVEHSENIVVNFQSEFPEPPTEITTLPLPVNDALGIAKKLNQLTALWLFRKDGYHARCFAVLYEIFATIGEGRTKPYASSAKFNLITAANDYMEAHWNDPKLTNEQLARQAKVSTVYFRKIFAEKYGIPPMRYIKEKRIDQAKILLQSGLSSVAGVAEAVGYSSIYHFSRAFKESTGETPTEYSRRMQASPK